MNLGIGGDVGVVGGCLYIGMVGVVCNGGGGFGGTIAPSDGDFLYDGIGASRGWTLAIGELCRASDGADVLDIVEKLVYTGSR